MSLSKFIKGWAGEAMGAVAHWAFLDKRIYFPLNNITLPTSNGTTQIDHVVVSKFGIFVIEAKNIDGWIFGDAKSPQWSIVKPGRKFRMQNPLHQNYRHVKAIAEFLNIGEENLHSIVMFWGHVLGRVRVQDRDAFQRDVHRLHDPHQELHRTAVF